MDFDTMIEEKKLQKEQVVKQMEGKKLEILDELVSFTKDWYDKKIISSIKDHSEKVFALGKEKASEFKEKTSTLLINTEEIVNRHVNVTNVWWHTNEKETSYYSGGHKVLPEIEDPMKVVFGELGNILSNYGLIKVGGSFGTHEEWSKDYGSTRMKYGYGISFTSRLIELSNQYVKLIDSCQKINSEISKIEEKKKRENIEEWWKAL